MIVYKCIFGYLSAPAESLPVRGVLSKYIDCHNCVERDVPNVLISFKISRF